MRVYQKTDEPKLHKKTQIVTNHIFLLFNTV